MPKIMLYDQYWLYEIQWIQEKSKSPMIVWNDHFSWIHWQPQDWAGVPIEMDTGEVSWEARWKTTGRTEPTAGSDRGWGWVGHISKNMVSLQYMYMYILYVFICICVCIIMYFLYLYLSISYRFRNSDAVGNGLKNNTHLPQRQNMPLFEMIWKKQLKAMHRITPYAFEQFQWHVPHKALRRLIWHHAVMLHWTGPRGIGAIHAGKCWIVFML